MLYFRYLNITVKGEVLMLLLESHFFNYVLGVLFFFFITSQASLQNSQLLRKKYKLTDALQLDRYIPFKNYFYYHYNDNFSFMLYSL